MIRIKLSFLLLLGLLPLYEANCHNYKFSETNEEMKDQIWIYVQTENIVFQYESEYLGQLAPHIRKMIDSNADSVLTAEEVESFFSAYKDSINNTLRNFRLFIDNKPSTIELIDVSAPTILTDSLLAPFKIKMMFFVNILKIEQGEHELVIDPKLLFSNGDCLINMAKKKVDFTDEQEKAIARFLQIQIFASDSILFTSTYPGYIKKNKKTVHIYGIFYDDTILRIKKSQYPIIQIKFNYQHESKYFK